jgi:hypothetical protein
VRCDDCELLLLRMRRAPPPPPRGGAPRQGRLDPRAPRWSD